MSLLIQIHRLTGMHNTVNAECKLLQIFYFLWLFITAVIKIQTLFVCHSEQVCDVLLKC